MKIILYAVIAVLILHLTCAQLYVAAADQPYTNTDLEKYQGSRNGSVVPEKPEPTRKQDSKVSRGSDEKSKRYWCSKGTALRAKVDKATDKVELAERDIAAADNTTVTKKKKNSSEHNPKSAEKKLRTAKKELYRAEQALEALEQDAHRQNVPPGWLRCQFSY
ncbi:MAG TPA: hypothetical protein VMB78_09495 [Dissulfurispiraceae bacterium]|nr:hypothetical protein [Dissulfurispiraceae bacterium]